MTARLKPYELGPFVPGVDNRRPEFKMRGTREDGGDFLRSAVNVDINNAGSVKRRHGFVSVLAGSGLHSLWADGADVFAARGSDLIRVSGLPGTAATATLRSDLAPNRPVSFSRAPDGIYYTNGQVIGRITASGSGPVNTPPLAVTPTVSGSLGGAMRPGIYGVCFTQLDADGRESGSTTPAYLEVPPEGSLSISNLPASFPSGVAAVVVYITEPNDSVLMRAQVLRSAAASTVFAVNPQLGARCPTVLLQAMPPGDIVRTHFGRLLVARDKLLMYSEPFANGLFNATRNYVPFVSPITAVEVTSGGVWVCADQTYWLAGADIAAAQLDAKLPYGAVPGSAGTEPNTNNVFWMSPRGLVRAGQDGSIKNLQEEHVAVPAAGFAACYFEEHDGQKRIGASQFDVGSNRMAAASYMDAEVVRKGVVL